MQPLWTAAAAREATGGHLQGDWTATGLSIDSRSLQPGDLFVALQAERDGHDFVADALAKGAAAALVSRLPENLPADAPLLLVDDVQTALEDLARAARARTRAKVIAVTGSVGKTTTKEMLRAALATAGQVHAAEASFNNHWGVPLTLARMPEDADFAVIEIGTSAPGEIAPLSRLARPQLALVTTVAAAHLAGFGTLEAIAREKASLYDGLEYDGLESDGIALANADLPTSPILFTHARAQSARLVTFGQAEAADARLVEMKTDAHSTQVRIALQGQERQLRLGIPAPHLALNALAVLAIADLLGADLDKASQALGNWRPILGRGTRERRILCREPRLQIELIDDAYNANPTSLAAGLAVLAASEPGPKGRRIAVLGDMLELGEHEAELHAQLAALPVMAALDLVFTTGPLMQHLHEALPIDKRGRHSESPEFLGQILPADLRDGDVVLVKGSNGSKVSRVVELLRATTLPADD